MKVFFSAYGYRDTTNWECPNCKNFWTCGMDLSVEESKTRHLAKCADKAPDITIGPSNKFGVWINGLFRRVDIGKLGEMLLELQTKNTEAAKEIEFFKTKIAQFSQDCVCRWENNRVTSLCSAHYAKVHEIVSEWKKTDMNGAYKIIPTLCRCGGSLAWVQVTETGAEKMIGCVCHTTWFIGKPVNHFL